MSVSRVVGEKCKCETLAHSPLNLNEAVEAVSRVNVYFPSSCSLQSPELVKIIRPSVTPTVTLSANTGRAKQARAITRRTKRAAQVAITARDTVESVIEGSVGRVGVTMSIENAMV
jgi:hypothetical protein